MDEKSGRNLKDPLSPSHFLTNNKHHYGKDNVPILKVKLIGLGEGKCKPLTLEKNVTLSSRFEQYILSLMELELLS